MDCDANSLRSDPPKYLGYRSYSKLVTVCQDYFILRKFDVLANRTALYLQDVIFNYEEKLRVIDKEASLEDGPRYNNGTFREDAVEDREQLVQVDIPNALERYCRCEST